MLSSRTAHPHCCPWKGCAHVSFFSILTVSCRGIGEERRQKRRRAGDSPFWLRMIKSSGMSHPAGADDTTKLQCVKDSKLRRTPGAGGRKRWERNCDPESVLTNWCWGEPEIHPAPPLSVASLYRQWPHYFLQKQAFPFTTLIWGAPRIPLKRRSVWRPFGDRRCSTWIVNVPTGGVQWLWAACGGVVKVNVWLWGLWFAIWTAWEEKLAPLQNCHFLCSSTALALEDIWGFF